MAHTAAILEYTIDGEDLDRLRDLIDEGGYTGTGPYKLVVRPLPNAGVVSFIVNDAESTGPCGQVTRRIPV